VADVRPSLVRVRALHEYEALQRTIADLDRVAARLASEGEAAADEALAMTARLLQELSDYVHLEELFVLPTIRRVDIWGDIRAQALAKEHEDRRDELGAIERAHPKPVDSRSLASDLHEFARGLRDGLQREARDVLGIDMLCDDVVKTAPD
jgi:hypothetical protein